jgi:N-acyl-D-aspartate/D-glutamate deacylase
VAPGFIDTHTHCDEGLGNIDSNVNLNYLIQGITTVVTGNCGNGTYKVMEIKVTWENQGIGTNAIHLVGCGDFREEVLGTEPREATPDDIEQLKSVSSVTRNVQVSFECLALS